MDTNPVLLELNDRLGIIVCNIQRYFGDEE